MDEKDLQLLRARADAVAYRATLIWAADLLCGALPPRTGDTDTEQVQIIKRKLKEHLADMQLTTFPELHPAESDLQAAELQEAAERSAKTFLDRIATNGR